MWLFQNIDFMPTILSRFDMIFIVKDEHDEGKDMVSWIVDKYFGFHFKF